MLLKKLLFPVIFCFTALTAKAQDSTSLSGSLNLRSGISIPTENFGEKTILDGNSGMADQGFHIAAEYEIGLDTYFGMGLTLGLRRNPVNLEEYNRQNPTNIRYAHTDWRSNYALVNTIFKYPLAPALALYFKVGGGASFNAYPDISASDTGNSKTKLKTAEGFAYGLGGGLKWQGKKAGVNFEVYNFRSSARFYLQNSFVKKDLDAVNYSLGLSFPIH